MKKLEEAILLAHVFSLQDRIGDIVAALPKATEVFSKYKIDFCCGGSRSLEEVINEKGIDGEAVLADLDTAHAEAQAMKDKQVDWREAPYGEFIDYIVNTHHAYTNQALSELSQLVTTILRVHGSSHPELSKLHRLFHSLKLELEQHFITEEEVVYPLIKQYEKDGSRETLAKAVEAFDQLESEHEGAGDILKEMREITSEYTLPSDACSTFDRTYALLQELETDLFQHIHLENNILHPRLRAELGKSS